MFNSQIRTKYRKGDNKRICQGDILKDLDFIFGDPAIDTVKERISLPYAVVLSQDCDLQSDFNCRVDSPNQDKYLISLLVCPAFILEDFAHGEHRSDWQMAQYNSDLISRIKNNDTYKRYHFLQGEKDLSIPDLVIDFKHFFTLPRDFVYNQKSHNYVASLNELFREELSQRFSNYLSRIGLPEV